MLLLPGRHDFYRRRLPALCLMKPPCPGETEGGALADLALQIFRGDGLLQVLVRMDHALIRQ
ncbi:hypothetical protein D7Y13_29880 [Corallococcus praedator]|uniref:Uncharacterized protein n=1 Tax=Corallococcus praedator TaxID=2316724 RepID=A0ABX9QC55_9BACT|nr:hypothetical protein D7X75_36015 [Corallococcus sp. CA031C]RKH97346.1 hypothetical protein D7Y13_29880 [Corallococcus praedator]